MTNEARPEVKIQKHVYKGRTERIFGSFWLNTKMEEMSDLEVRLSEVLMKEIVVSILAEIIREEMNESDSRESVLDEVFEFRTAIVKSMREDSRNPKDTFKVERLPSALKEAWKAWKTGRDGPTGHAPLDELRREEVSYRVFLDTIEFKPAVDKDVER